MPRKVAIIGGGAAGLAAAIAAARGGAEVSILEASERVGSKILTTGNGRCNFSNADITPQAYNNPEFVEPVLRAMDSEAVARFFASLGLIYRTDAEGRRYPLSDTANSVLDVLRLECAHLGVREQCGFSVIDIRPRTKDQPQAPFTLVAQSGLWVSADAVVLATGDDLSLVSYLGHTKIRTQPVLCPLRTTIDRTRGFTNIRVRCAASLMEGGEVVARETGELLFRDYGVSGIMVFDLSRFAHAGQQLVMDFFPDMDEGQLRDMLEQRADELSWRTTDRFLDGMMHPRIGAAIMRSVGMDMSALAHTLKSFSLDVLGPGDVRQAQVQRGGLSTVEVDPQTLSSKLIDGLYAAGEVLDVDGRCGGFNLHWAWASGIVAGTCAARGLRGGDHR